MSKRFMTVLTCLLASACIVSAQNRIKGKVIEEETGEPVIGASVMVVGTKTGAITNTKGEFVLNPMGGG